MAIQIDEEISLSTLDEICRRFAPGCSKTTLVNKTKDGQVKTLVECRNGKANGVYAENFENGQRRVRYQFFQGLEQGEGKEWDKNGEIVLISNSHMGKLHGRQSFYQKGLVDEVEVWVSGTHYLTTYRDNLGKFQTEEVQSSI